MKKFKISFFVAAAIIATSAMVFAGKSESITAGWYGQLSDAVPPYNTVHPINVANLNSKCPTGTAHLCAALLKSDGTLDGTQSPNTRMSNHNFQP